MPARTRISICKCGHEQEVDVGCDIALEICGVCARIGNWLDEEWFCPECNATGKYYDIRCRFDSGVDCCPECRSPVECIE